MRAIIRRAILPALFLIGGLASLIYGAKFHSARCWRTTKRRRPSRSPRRFRAGAAWREALPAGRRPFGEPLPLVKKTVKQVEGSRRWHRSRH